MNVITTRVVHWLPVQTIQEIILVERVLLDMKEMATLFVKVKAHE